jgi:peptidoglycan/LPS O-acetylase OafA/YrhL
MQMGYTILTAAGPVHHVELWTASIISGAIVLAWATWRFVERPAHRWMKDRMTAYAAKLGWKSHPKANVGNEGKPA